MGLYDSKKVVVAIKYGATATGTDAVSVTNEDVRVNPTSGTGNFKELNGKLGNKTTWMNTDDTTNLWAVTKTAALLQTLNDADDRLWPKAPEFLHAATRQGARAIRRADDLGQLRAGGAELAEALVAGAFEVTTRVSAISRIGPVSMMIRS